MLVKSNSLDAKDFLRTLKRMGTYIKIKQHMTCCGSCDLSHEADYDGAVVRAPDRARAANGWQAPVILMDRSTETLQPVFGQEIRDY
jgi:hypothetical protein